MGRAAMTTELKGVLVTFKDDIRGDDADRCISAIQQIRGVLSVEPVPPDVNDHIARVRVHHELWGKVLRVFFPEVNP